MPTTLPRLGTCKYGTHEFTAAMETVSFKSTPVYDAAGRTVTHSSISIAIKDVVFAPVNNTTDAMLETIRVELSQPARAFYYQSKGWGDFTVNVGGRRDVLWGPKPKRLSFKPHGNAAAEIEWEVEVCV